MTDTPVPRLSPDEEGNPVSDLKTDVIKDVEREHTITGDFVGPRSDEMPDDSAEDDAS
ncbi:hypothetical protein K0817_000385 [Microbacterium sp. HD4P20]|uniref:hypothetical protein n=1 Tax=Microbacterium sp. HD4P20 TaxID=2864874 RepID=UPI0020A60F92|nr:hypothetical protein [Microbacterium sp. HD4P20]MCP2635022.1 hypothetical protein [Microbacterium sp. HD4P20]